MFAEIYRTAHASGQLTPADWDQIAPHIKTTYELREATVRDLQHLEQRLLGLSKQAKGRRKELAELTQESDRLFRRLDRDDRRVGQVQALRLWHLAVQQSPNLPATLSDTRAQVNQRLQVRSQLLQQIQSAAADTDVRGIQSVHTRHRREIREAGFAIGMLAREHREALPSGLGDDDSSHTSPEEIANSYTLTPDEAVVLAVAQCWLMSYCSRDEADQADTEAFMSATVQALTEMDSSVLSSWPRDLAEGLPKWDAKKQRRYLQDSGVIKALAADGVASRVRSLLILIELATFHPWRPEDPDRPLKTARKWDEDAREEGLRRLAGVLPEVDESDADRVREQAKDSSETLFKGSMLVPIALILAGGVAAGALTAGLAAPAIGAMIGTTVFGLSGAAATSAGLAALGGGSLAAGGLGMAGGTALISATGGLLGMGLGAGSAAGAEAVADAQARVLGRLAADIVKLHSLGVVVLIEELHDVGALDATIQGLRNRREELQQVIESGTEPKMPEGAGPQDEEALAAHNEAVAAYKEEKKRLETAEQALSRAIDDLLKRRTALVREIGEDAN